MELYRSLNDLSQFKVFYNAFQSYLPKTCTDKFIQKPCPFGTHQYLSQGLKNTPTDPYFGHKSIAMALEKQITSSPALRRRRRPTASEPFSSSSLDIYIARVIHVCRVPVIVPYAVLYLLTAVSRTCDCEKRLNSQNEKPSNDTHDSSHKPPSIFSHRLSQFLSGDPFKRGRRPFWTAHHFFIGGLLYVLKRHHKNYPPSTLAKTSGVEMDDLIHIHIAISFRVNRDTALTLAWMIKESEFRSLSDVECPIVISHRKRLEERKKNRRSSLGHMLSIRRSRRNSTSSIESHHSWTSFSKISCSS